MAFGTVISQFFNQNNLRNLGTTKGQPYINSTIATLNNPVSTTYLDTSRKQTYMYFFEKENGVLTALINMIASDMAGEVYFEPIGNQVSGRNKIQKARKFYDLNQMRMLDHSENVDLLVTGESYTYLNKLPNEVIVKEIKKALKRKSMPVNDLTISMFYKANIPDEDSLSLRNLRYIPSSTMQNIYNEIEIKNYVQRVASNYREFSKEEIIHSKLYDVNGRPYGFTPVSSMIVQLQLDSFMWGNMHSLAKNGGQGDRIYSVEDIDINSVAFKRIEKELQKYHALQNRHGSLLLNGKINVQDLQQLDSMQFKELGFYIASLLAMQWRIPKSRLTYIVGGTNTKEDTGGNSEKSYYDNISFLQDLRTEIKNQQLWIPHFGVKMKYKKSYLQDDLRETQTQQMRLDNLSKIESELRLAGKQLTPEYKIRYINRISEDIGPEDIETLKTEDLSINGTSSNRDKQLDNNTLNDNSDQANVRAKKKLEQETVNTMRGQPTGLGKEQIQVNITETKKDEPKLNLKELLRQEIEGKEVKRVPFLTFIRLYNEDKAFNTEPPRVFRSDANNMTRFTYKSTDFVFETIVPTEEISQVNLMNFRKIYVIKENEMLEIIDGQQQEVPGNDSS